MTSRAPLILAHHHPGRLRVRCDSLCGAKRDAEAVATFDRIRTTVSAMNGVRSVRFNAGSGSVVVEYEPGAVDPNALIGAISLTANLAPPPTEDEVGSPSDRPARIAIGAARELNALTRDLTGGRMDLRALIPVAMTGLATYSFIVGSNRLPRWDNLAYWAFSIFQTLHATEIADRETPTS